MTNNKMRTSGRLFYTRFFLRSVLTVGLGLCLIASAPLYAAKKKPKAIKITKARSAKTKPAAKSKHTTKPELSKKPQPVKHIQPKAENDSNKSFKDALISAYLTNSGLQSQLHQLYSQFEARPQALAGYRPQISANLNQNYDKVRDQNYRTSSAPGSPESRASYYTRSPTGRVTLQQHIYSGGQTAARVAQADNTIQAARYGYLAAEQQTLSDAIKAYLDVILNLANLEHALANERYMEKSLEEAKIRLEVGEASITEVAQSETYLADAQAKTSAARGAVESSNATYEKVIGVKPKAESMKFPELLINLPKTKEEMIRKAEKRNPTLLNAVYVEKVAKYATAEQLGKLLPSITVNGSANRQITKGSERYTKPDRKNTYSAGVTLNIPIYQGGSEWSSIRQNYQGEVKARFDREAARKSIIEQASQAWENWLIANKQIEQFKTQIKAATVTRDSAVLELEVGEGTKLTVLDAQTKLLQAQQGLEQARHDALLAAYQILSFIGTLTTKDLGLSVERYDVDGYYDVVKDALFGTAPGADMNSQRP